MGVRFPPGRPSKGLRVRKYLKGEIKLNSTVTIGIESGAFSITIGGKRYHIDQEDDPSVELQKLFESFGYNVEISEDY